ncbi:hypothetical protein MTO96_041482 [Rhipicephalus appendiculatus]
MLSLTFPQPFAPRTATLYALPPHGASQYFVSVRDGFFGARAEAINSPHHNRTLTAKSVRKNKTREFVESRHKTSHPASCRRRDRRSLNSGVRPIHPPAVGAQWFLKDDPQLIYQRITALNKWFVSSRLKDRINLACSLSNGNSFTKFRVLNLVRPTTELSDRYSCHVMSLAGPGSKPKLMATYVPPKRFDSTYERVSADVTILSCEADGVFPQPALFFYQSSGREPLSRPVVSAPARVPAPTPQKALPATTCI